MTVRTRKELYRSFKEGVKPSVSQYNDLLDSLVFPEDDPAEPTASNRKILFVDANAGQPKGCNDDYQGKRGSIHYPFASVEEALDFSGLAASYEDGNRDLIYVFPGRYCESKILKYGVDLYFSPQCYVYSDTNILERRTTFSDIMSNQGNGSQTFNVYGHAQFESKECVLLSETIKGATNLVDLPNIFIECESMHSEMSNCVRVVEGSFQIKAKKISSNKECVFAERDSKIELECDLVQSPKVERSILAHGDSFTLKAKEVHGFVNATKTKKFRAYGTKFIANSSEFSCVEISPVIEQARGYYESRRYAFQDCSFLNESSVSIDSNGSLAANIAVQIKGESVDNLKTLILPSSFILDRCQFYSTAQKSPIHYVIDRNDENFVQTELNRLESFDLPVVVLGSCVTNRDSELLKESVGQYIINRNVSIDIFKGNYDAED